MTLKQARTLVGLTQAQLAKASGIKKSAISDIEIGRVSSEHVACRTILSLVRALRQAGLKGLTPEDLCGVETVEP
jgi:transcriptional regulator with XRE-family HTH domain